MVSSTCLCTHHLYEVVILSTYTGECLNTFLDELGIATSENAIDRDNLLSLSRRDASLLTHDHSRERWEANEQRKREEAEAAQHRKEEAERQREAQREQDLFETELLFQRYRADVENGTHNTLFASWRTCTLNAMKAFYRVHIPKEQKPRQQPSRKEQWINILKPRLAAAAVRTSPEEHTQV